MPTAPLGAGLRFLAGHATHPDGHMALALAAAQVEAERAERPGFEPTLGLLYLSDTLVAQGGIDAHMAMLSAGTTGAGTTLPAGSTAIGHAAGRDITGDRCEAAGAEASRLSENASVIACASGVAGLAK